MLQTMVKIEQGELRGKIETLSNNKPYVSFKGIPYAKPPVGPLRFKDPQPPEPWKGIKDVYKHGNISLQMTENNKIIGSEDCLFLNVYTPNTNADAEKKFPVMIFFHGGSYIRGSGNSQMYGPQYLLMKDVVLVTANYRLEVLGFLCMHTEEIPGNAGLKDQVAVMKWVNKNITFFGGDLNNVTIFGESAGAASVTYHMFSPITKGLFHKVIAESSVCTHNHNLETDPTKRAFLLGKLLRCETKDPKELTEFLKRVDAIKLAGVSDRLITYDERIREYFAPFRPVIERSFPNSQAFITKLPSEMLNEGIFHNVPIILGYNDSEGIYQIREFLKSWTRVNNDCEKLIPIEISSKLSPVQSDCLSRKIKQFYFNNEPISKNNIGSIVNLRSDKHWCSQMYIFAKHIAMNSSYPVYFYKFSCDTNINFGKSMYGDSALKGASHFDELFYIFKSFLTDHLPDATTEIGRQINRVTHLWTNMAKYGNPTPIGDDVIPLVWEPISEENFQILNIGKELESVLDPDKARHDFWKKIYMEEYIDA